MISELIIGLFSRDHQENQAVESETQVPPELSIDSFILMQCGFYRTMNQGDFLQSEKTVDRGGYPISQFKLTSAGKEILDQCNERLEDLGKIIGENLCSGQFFEEQRSGKNLMPYISLKSPEIHFNYSYLGSKIPLSLEVEILPCFYQEGDNNRGIQTNYPKSKLWVRIFTREKLDYPNQDLIEICRGVQNVASAIQEHFSGCYGNHGVKRLEKEDPRSFFFAAASEEYANHVRRQIEESNKAGKELRPYKLKNSFREITQEDASDLFRLAKDRLFPKEEFGEARLWSRPKFTYYIKSGLKEVEIRCMSLFIPIAERGYDYKMKSLLTQANKCSFDVNRQL